MFFHSIFVSPKIKNVTMKRSVLIVLTMILSFSLLATPSVSRPKKKDKKNREDISCFDVPTKSEIIHQILLNQKIKSELQLTRYKKEPIKIKTNQHVVAAIDVNVFHYKALMVDNISHYPDAVSIEFSKMSCKKNTLEFEISSITEGVRITGGLLRDLNTDKWKVEIFEANHL